MKKSETIGKLAKALAGFQGEVQTIGTDKKNAFLKNDYATLGQLIEDTKQLRAKWGLAVAQFPEGEGGLTTLLMHDSGEWLEASSQITLQAEKGNSLAQSAGKLITYQRRYAYASVLGLVSDSDADGNIKPESNAGKGIDADILASLEPAVGSAKQCEMVAKLLSSSKHNAIRTATINKLNSGKSKISDVIDYLTANSK